METRKAEAVVEPVDTLDAKRVRREVAEPPLTPREAYRLDPVQRDLRKEEVTARRNEQVVEPVDRRQAERVERDVQEPVPPLTPSLAARRDPVQRDLADKTVAPVDRVADVPPEDYTSDYRTDFKQTYGTQAGFDDMRPAYEYGARCALDARYRDKSWEQVENDLRTDYETGKPLSNWDQSRSAIRYAWQRALGNR